MSRVEITRRSIRNHLIGGIAVATFLVVGVGGWASTTELSGAVIAPGSLVVDTSVKKVQHPTGGVVGELNVRDGDRVKQGDVLLRLDETVTRANLSIVTKNLDELAARQARDEAERDGESRIDFPAELLGRAKTSPEIARLISGETKLFEIRRASREGEREGLRELWKKGLVQINRVTSLQRDAARLEGERGQLVAATAESRGKIVETELQILQIDQEMRSEVGKELAEIRGRTSEYVERKIAAEDQLKRIDIRAPQDGTVHQLAVHTVGGVITAQGEPIMLIVPEADALRVEAKIQPQEIDQLHIGQRAVLRFSSFNQRTTPELNGEVAHVSADISQDQKTAATFYTIHIRMPPDELKRLEGLRLVPGMPVEAFVQTSPRTVMSYLVRPLQDQLMRAFREK